MKVQVPKSVGDETRAQLSWNAARQLVVVEVQRLSSGEVAQLRRDGTSQSVLVEPKFNRLGEVA